MDVRGDMFEYLRAVPWFAGTEPRGGVEGRVVVEGGRGEWMMVPKGEKEEEVRGVVGMVVLGEEREGAIVGDGGRWKWSVEGEVW